MKRTLTTLMVAAFVVGGAIYAGASPRRVRLDQQQPHKRRVQQRPEIDMVIALDTSGSMSGLINAAREKLWDIVNEAARVQPAPRLRVGLLTYGGPGSEDDGYVVVRHDLTTDLDAIYGTLFELRTSGGTEYVGRVVYRAVNELSWSQSPRALKQIYVAGNESADQDRRVSWRMAVRHARRRQMFVNTIYCGNNSGSEALGWKRVAQGGAGVYAAIDHNHGTINIASPYDAKLNALSAKLNSTYVGYGALGARASVRQAKQDHNAAKAHSSAGAARARAKASPVYRADRWDLVDARKAGKLASINKEALPAGLRGKSDDEINSYLDKKEKDRQSIRRQIVELSKKRKRWVAAEMKKRGRSEGKAFDGAVRRAFQEQAEAAGLSIE